MNPLLAGVAITLIFAQLFMPRRYAFAPLLIATFHIPYIQFLPYCSVVRIVVLAALIREFTSKYNLTSSSPLDKCLILWALLAILSGFAHESYDGNPVILRFGLAFDYLSAYLWARSYIVNFSDIQRVSKCLVLILLPMAAIMLYEKVS